MSKTRKPNPIKEDLIKILKELLSIFKALIDIILGRLEEWEGDRGEREEKSKRHILLSFKEKVRREVEKCSLKGDEPMTRAFLTLEGFIEEELTPSRTDMGKKARKVKIK